MFSDSLGRTIASPSPDSVKVMMSLAVHIAGLRSSASSSQVS